MRTVDSGSEPIDIGAKSNSNIKSCPPPEPAPVQSGSSTASHSRDAIEVEAADITGAQKKLPKRMAKCDPEKTYKLIFFILSSSDLPPPPIST